MKNNLNQLNFLNKDFESNSKDKNNHDTSSFKTNNQKSMIEKQQNKFNTILILDTETSGLDEHKNEIIEVGCILFHLASKSVLSQLSFLLPVNENEAQFVNGIDPVITKISQPWEESINLFMKLVESSDLIIAHNAEFDKKWFGKGRLPKINKKWVCSLEDINWSFKKSLKMRPSVTDLALSFDIPVWKLHRALSDCFYLSEVFKKCVNLEEMLIKASVPRSLYKAIVSYEDRALAKKAGFLWNGPVNGAWARKLTEEELIELDFKVERIS